MSDSPVSNDHAVSVSELAASLKRTIESNFDHVVVRGELGRVTIARSGHMYADIKDDKAVLNTIMWKGQVDKLPFRPEEGLEVIATGRLSIYEGRSNYQLLASSMRPAGAGALMALLENARQHADPGTLTVRLYSSGTSCHLSVEDEGPGIPAEAASYVFEAFRRVDPSRSRTSGGSGLGLAVVKAVVEAHGGHVVCQPSGRGGTIFVLSWPIRQI